MPGSSCPTRRRCSGWVRTSLSPEEGSLSGRGDDEEHLTAYYEVDCETLDRAKEIGAYVLDHHVTSVEIRRIHDTAEKPS